MKTRCSCRSQIIWMLMMVSAFFACDETIEADDSSFGYDFFPLQTGDFRVYEIEEIVFAIAELPDTIQYQLKEVTADSVPDNAGEISYILQRWKRSVADDPWILDSVWTAFKNDVHLVVSENNVPLMKLVFPFKEEKTWDSNSLNARNRDDFEMREVFSSYSGNFEDYQSTVTIIQEDKLDSIISLDNRFEIFARNIGLVEKVNSRLEFCQESDCFGQKIVKEGKILTQSLIEYGKE